MITALQNFISKKGKFVFILLLVVVSISFVLYLAQGASVFDHLPDPNYQKKEFYGVDLNDPDESRKLSISNQVASDFGAIVGPVGEVFEKADVRYLESLQAQLQSAFQSQSREIDQEALQRLFQYMQSWSNFPDSYKVMEIARSGNYDFDFSDSSLKAKLTIDSLANKLEFLPLQINHPGINTYYDKFIQSLDPSLASEENRTQAFEFIGQRRGVSLRGVDSILYSHFRAKALDRLLGGSGYTLGIEGELELHRTNFAWDGDAYSLNSDDFDHLDPPLTTLTLNELPAEGDRLGIVFASKRGSFEFVRENKESNGSKHFIKLTDDINSTLSALSKSIVDSAIGLSVTKSTDSLTLRSNLSILPAQLPKFSSSSQSLIIDRSLQSELAALHELRKEEDLFAEPARTFATAVAFNTNDFLIPLPEPDEERMRSYFQRNKDQFLIPSDPPSPKSEENYDQLKGAKGPLGEPDSNSSSSLELNLLSELQEDLNVSTKNEVTFEEVRVEVKQRIIDGDKIDAERDAEEMAQEAALDFLEEINGLKDLLRSQYPNYQELRNSTEFEELIKSTTAKTRSISFSKKDISIQGRILGLERRESEKRSNREPLEEVNSLNERLFFTRSIRRTKEGFSIFVLDRKTDKTAGKFEDASFALLYKEYAKNLRLEAFNAWLDQVFIDLEGNRSDYKSGQFVSVEKKSSATLGGAFDKRSRKLSSELSSLEKERNEISAGARDSNQTKSQSKRKIEIDETIEKIRDQQSELNRERALASRLIESAVAMEPAGNWVEKERTENSALFIRLRGVYTMRSQEVKSDEISNSVADLEFVRAEKGRNLIVADLIGQGLSAAEAN